MNTQPLIAIQINDDRYEIDGGRVLQRERGDTPNGNPIGGRWVLREADGTFIDVDQYRNDLFERHNILPISGHLIPA